MNTVEINALLRGCAVTRASFVGTFPANRLPDPLTLRRPCSFVANVDPSGLPGSTLWGFPCWGFAGSHWVAFYLDARNQLTYFDSCSENAVNDIKSFLSTFAKYERLSFRIQDFLSDLCGHYCIYFIFKRSCGRSTRFIERKFSRTNLGKNDNFVKRWILRFLKTHFTVIQSDEACKLHPFSSSLWIHSAFDIDDEHPRRSFNDSSCPEEKDKSLWNWLSVRKRHSSGESLIFWKSCFRKQIGIRPKRKPIGNVKYQSR